MLKKDKKVDGFTMFKRIFSRKKQKDIRFMPYEEYRTTIEKKPSAQALTSSWMCSNDALKIGIEGSESDVSTRPILSIQQFSQLPEAPAEENTSYIFVESEYKIDNAVKTTPQVSHTDKKRESFLNSLGVFSDTKMYSALISSELKQHNINLKYFHHPQNFVANQYSFFDKISAWIVFLSEDADERFLESFIDRYIDKPCLFLFEKGNRNKTGAKVSRFLEDNGLIQRYSHLRRSLELDFVTK